MKVRAKATGYYGERRKVAGEIFEFHGNNLASWMEDVSAIPKREAEDEPEETKGTTLHQMAGRKASRVAKPGGRERSAKKD